ncbi:unnamed protein product [Dibothriocephalus latus]|uniref:Uncharacterized protein n=1 Tax=Dibothriocephalus latus TaxID=60516 RepID=A0A3P7NX04_DIBLA|nr:unnamed protein product [Dibothriocephalus latus]
MQKEIDSKKPTLAAMRSGSAADLNGEAVSDTSVLLFSGHFADLESQFFTESERMKAATYHINDFNCECFNRPSHPFMCGPRNEQNGI